MKTRIISLFALCMVCLASCVESSQPAISPLKVVGTRLTNDQGKAVQLRGVSFGWHNWHPRFYTAEGVKLLKEKWGANIVRAAIGVEPENSYIEDPINAIKLATTIADAAIANDMYALIDWHSHHIRLPEAKEFFTAMATRYSGVPNVLYEIYNEPVDDTWPEIKTYAEEVIATIRAIDPNAIIIVGTPRWSQEVDVAALDPIEGSNIMYTLHFYAATHKQELRDRAEKALAAGLPIFITECGGMNANGSVALDHDSWRKWIDWADDHMISWIAWSISDKDEVCSMYLYNAPDTGSDKDGCLREWGRMVRDELLRKSNSLYIQLNCDNNWTFDQSEKIALALNLTANKASKGVLKAVLHQDIDRTKLDSVSATYNLTAGQEQAINLEFSAKEEGIYTIDIYQDKVLYKTINVAVEPLAIVSELSREPDFLSFWKQNLAELAKVAPAYKIKEVSQGESRDLYIASMKSVDDATVQCYVAVPKDKRKRYPVVINYMGYGSPAWQPDINLPSAQIDIVVSVRGQGLNQPDNIYGDWGTYGLESKESYYYRGAYLDVVRIIDFAAQYRYADPKHIYAQGDSQGGAFTFVAAALDHRIKAAAPGVPFLSDFEDYFRIVGWPGNVILAAAKEKNIDEKALFRTLSYFDIKNLAPMIQCPIAMYAGLQDPTCPPHINFAAYNQVQSPKTYYLHPYGGHAIDCFVWNPMRDKFLFSMK